MVDRNIFLMYFMHDDCSTLMKRSDAKQFLSQLEKRVQNNNPDFISLKSCSKFLLFELNRKEWTKYYFTNISSISSSNFQSAPRTHIILSKYPIQQHVVENNVSIARIQIAYNDLPKCYDFDGSEQSNINRFITIITSVADDPADNYISTALQQQPIGLLIFNGTNSEYLNDCGGIMWKTVEDTENNEESNLSQMWECTDYNEKSKLATFTIVDVE